MLKAILIDDEKYALEELTFLLAAHSEIDIIGAYTNSIAGLEAIEQLQPHVVFLDIEMPQLKGTDIASRLLQVCPHVDIVFITAFNQYAIRAFELHALDYLMKPVEPLRLAKTVERLLKNRKTAQKKLIAQLHLQLLGSFQIAWSDQEPIKWRAEKNKELMAFLLHSQGRRVSKEEILDTLWPNYDPEKALVQLYNGIYYIRKTMRDYRIPKNILHIDSQYNLILHTVATDAMQIRQLAQSTVADEQATLERIETLYQGDYFAGEDYPWMFDERQRLEKIYVTCLVKLANLYIKAHRLAQAEDRLLKAYTKNPYEEEITILLLQLYKEQGKKSAAIQHFQHYEQILREELHILPEKRIISLYQLING